MDIRYNTATTVWLGPFKSTDGVSSSTGLTLTAYIAKNNGAWAATTGTISETTVFKAWYKIPLTATNVATYGNLEIACQSSSEYLDVWKGFNIINQNVYDSRYGSDYTKVDVIQGAGTTGNVDKMINASTKIDDLNDAVDVSTDVNDILTNIAALNNAVDVSTDVNDILTNIAALNDLSTTDILTQARAAVDASTQIDDIATNVSAYDLLKIGGSTGTLDNFEDMFDGTGYAGGSIRLQTDWVETNGSTEIDTNVTPATFAKEIYSKLINDSYKDTNEYKFYSSTGGYLFSLSIATTQRVRSS
jgi:hypothetical protein